MGNATDSVFVAREDEGNFSKAYVNYVIVLLAFVNLINYVDRMILSVALQPIKDEMGFSDSQLGLLTGFAFALFYALCAVPIARWADRGSRRNLITLAIAAWSVMTALTGLSRNFLHLFLTRTGVGVGEAGCIPPSHSLISDYVPMEQRSSAMAINTAGCYLGTVVGLVLGGWFCTHYGWRTAFVALGLPGIVVAFLVRLTLKEPPRGFADGKMGNLEPPLPLAEGVKRLWKTRSYVHITAALSVSTLVVYGLNMWLPTYYIRQFDMTPAQVGAFFGIAYGLGMTIGILVGGLYGDRLVKKDARWAMWLGAGSMVIVFPLFLAVFFSPTVTIALGFNFVSSIFATFAWGPVFAMVQSVAHPRMRATAVAVITFFSALIGTGGGPLIVGVASDMLAARVGDASLRYSLIGCTIFMLYPVIHFILGARHLVEDIASASIIQRA